MTKQLMVASVSIVDRGYSLQTTLWQRFKLKALRYKVSCLSAVWQSSKMGYNYSSSTLFAISVTVENSCALVRSGCQLMRVCSVGTWLCFPKHHTDHDPNASESPISMQIWQTFANNSRCKLSSVCAHKYFFHCVHSSRTPGRVLNIHGIVFPLSLSLSPPPVTSARADFDDEWWRLTMIRSPPEGKCILHPFNSQEQSMVCLGTKTRHAHTHTLQLDGVSFHWMGFELCLRCRFHIAVTFPMTYRDRSVVIYRRMLVGHVWA